MPADFVVLTWISLLGGLWALLIYHLSIQWSVYEQYHFGWAVPFLCLYLVARRIPSRSSIPIFERSSDLLNDLIIAGKNHLSCVLHTGQERSLQSEPARLVWLVAIAALLYAPIRWLYEANPLWRLLPLLWSLELIAATLCLVYWLRGVSGVWRYWPPVAFFLFAVPWPSSIESFLVNWLTRVDTATAVELLALVGVPSLQHGNSIEVATGSVGVDEACSGVRSLQATLMLSVFLGEFYRLSIFRRAVCVLASCVIAFLGNLARTVLLTWVSAAKGLTVLKDWHDPAGISVLLSAFIGLWFIARWLSRFTRVSEQKLTKTTKERPDEPQDSRANSRVLSLLSFPPVKNPLGTSSSHHAHRPRLLPPFPGLAFTALLTLWLGAVEMGISFWYRPREAFPANLPGWTVNSHPEIPNFKPCEVGRNILEQLQPDQAFAARWEDSSSLSAQIYYFRWLPARSARRRAWLHLARAHSPDICLPALGLQWASNCGTITIPLEEVSISLQHSVFVSNNRSLQVFFGMYDDRSGPGQPVDARNDLSHRFAAALAGDRISGQRFLEIILFDVERPEEAVTALRALLPQMICAAPADPPPA